MPDIGFGEILVIVVIALLVFGPDRLPKMAADAARTLRQVRQMAASARKDLVDAAGLTGDEEMAQTFRDLRDLDPRRAMKDVVADDPTPRSTTPSGAVGPGATGSSPAGPGAPPPTGADAGSGPGAAAGAGAQPVAPPVVAPAQADPDWT